MTARDREAAVRALAEGVPCVECGSLVGSPRAAASRHGGMVWHHVDAATKLFDVSSAPTVAAAIAEIAKCVRLCRGCHSRYHAIERAGRARAPGQGVGA